MEQRTVLGGKKNKASFREYVSLATRRLLAIEGNLSDDVGKFLFSSVLNELLACDYFILHTKTEDKMYNCLSCVWEVT